MSQAAPLFNRLPGLSFLRSLPRTAQLGGAGALVALIVVSLLWSRSPDYSILFSNLDDRDGGTIVSALGQMNVPYQFSENGSAILVPKDRVHEARMQLAGQGLPRGGNVGFELLDQSRFGASQFTEQVTYQRALEGELANSIRAVHSVQEARVHLAIPRETLFVRDKQAPTASVLVSLYPGRSLSESQVAAIRWLVSSSVPSLNAEHVSIVDQDGRLLTPATGEAGSASTQRDVVADIEHRAVQRILTILNPVLGPGNIRAQVSADVDFARREQTSEVYKPNQKPGQASVRSEQISLSLNGQSAPPEGVPGSLTNQAPLSATAPLTEDAGTARLTTGGANAAQPAPSAPPTPVTADSSLAERLSDIESPTNPLAATGNGRSDITKNYEVDRTISHTQHQGNELRRLSIAVVVNHRLVDKEYKALSDVEIDNIKQLVMQAVGFSIDRGDSISVINSQFTEPEDHSVPFWKNSVYTESAVDLLKYLAYVVVFFLFWRIVINPIIQGVIQARTQSLSIQQEVEEDLERQQAAKERAAEINRYEDNISTARLMAEKDPRAVAMVLRSWMNTKNPDDDNKRNER